MAIVRAYRSFDSTDTSIWFGAVTSYSATHITITSGAISGTYRGNFNYDIYGRVFGQLNSYEQIEYGQIAYRVTNLDLNAYETFTEIQSGSSSDILPVAFQGSDSFYGSHQADVLDGYSGNDAISASNGNDTLIGNAGDDRLDGGAGRDTAVYSGNQSSYTLTLSPAAATLTDRRPDGNGADTLVDMELLDFDTEIPAMGGNPMNLDRFGGPVALNEAQFADLIELYIAYFNRAPDATGLYFWATALNDRLSLEEIGARFSAAAETKALYPDGSSNPDLITAVYNNVLGRDPDQGGFEHWLRGLDSGAIPPEIFILRLLAGAQGSDIDYIENKVDIGTYFTVIKGMSNSQNGKEVMELFDGSQQSIEDAIAATDQFHADALDPNDGEFLMPLVGVLDDPFAVA